MLTWRLFSFLLGRWRRAATGGMVYCTVWCMCNGAPQNILGLGPLKALIRPWRSARRAANYSCWLYVPVAGRDCTEDLQSASATDASRELRSLQ